MNILCGKLKNELAHYRWSMKNVGCIFLYEESEGNRQLHFQIEYNDEEEKENFMRTFGSFMELK